MPLVLTSPPLVEPVSLAEAKAHLRVDHAFEDTLIGSLVTAARVHLELSLSRAFITQGWSLFLDRWPVGHVVQIPLAPVQSIASVLLRDEDGSATALPSSAWFLDAVSHPARLVPTSGGNWPAPGRSANGIEIAFAAGFGRCRKTESPDWTHGWRRRAKGFAGIDSRPRDLRIAPNLVPR